MMDFNRLNSGKKLIDDLVQTGTLRPVSRRNSDFQEKNAHNAKSRKDTER